jgi:peptidoglycan/LPS O-acetylase OafA/YrhL
LAAIFAAFMLWVVVAARREGEGRSPIATFLTSKTMLLLGLCSYSIFLWNHPLLYWLENHGLIVTGFAGFLLVGAVLALPLLALAYCTYRWVELPALRLKSIRLTGSAAAGRTASTG